MSQDSLEHSKAAQYQREGVQMEEVVQLFLCATAAQSIVLRFGF